MLDKLKGLLGDGKMIQELQSMGIDTDTLKKALENFPPVAQQIQTILASSDSNQVKITKITSLVTKAARGTATADTTSSSTTDTDTETKR